MSPMWDAEPQRDSGPCAACGQHAENGIVRWIARQSTADIRLIFHEDPEQCPPEQPAPETPPARRSTPLTARGR
jgi:hypothetical protein